MKENYLYPSVIAASYCSVEKEKKKDELKCKFLYEHQRDIPKPLLPSSVPNLIQKKLNE